MRSFKEHIMERRDQALTVARLLDTDNPTMVAGNGEVIEINNYDDFVNYYLMFATEATKIGKGSFSDAYASKDKQWVLKAANTEDWYDPFHDYVALAQKSAGKNSLLPKILWSGEKWQRKFVILEYVNVFAKLDPIPILSKTYPNTTHPGTYFTRDLQMLAYGEHDRLLRSVMEVDKVLKSYKSSYKDYMDWVDLCSKNLEVFPNGADIHSYNMGVRKDGSLVIFDPVA